MAVIDDGTEYFPTRWEDVTNKEDALAFAYAVRLIEDSAEELPVRVPLESVFAVSFVIMGSILPIMAVCMYLGNATQGLRATGFLFVICLAVFLLSLRCKIVFHRDHFEVTRFLGTKRHSYRDIVSVQWSMMGARGTPRIHCHGVRVWLKGWPINRVIALVINDELTAGLAHAYHHPDSNPGQWLPVPAETEAPAAAR
jgi:hypothetical protein